MEDLGDLIGECDNYHTPIRYAHLISHPDWGFMTVASQCAENLTSEYGLSFREEEAKQLAQQYMRYMKSPKWKHRKNGNFMDFDNYHIKIWENGSYFSLEIFFPLWNLDTMIKRFEKQKGKKKYLTLNDAKTQAFKVITDRSLIRYCAKHYQRDTPYPPGPSDNDYD